MRDAGRGARVTASNTQSGRVRLRLRRASPPEGADGSDGKRGSGSGTRARRIPPHDCRVQVIVVDDSVDAHVEEIAGTDLGSCVLLPLSSFLLPHVRHPIDLMRLPDRTPFYSSGVHPVHDRAYRAPHALLEAFGGDHALQL